MQKQIRFKQTVISTVLGTFVTGDLARVPADHAEHLVDELGVAEYVDAAVEPVQTSARVAPPKPPAKRAPR